MEYMTIDELVGIQKRIIEDLEYDLTRAKSPKSIRNLKSALKYHKSLHYYLTKPAFKTADKAGNGE